MNENWINIKDKRPTQDQPVWYYFSVFDKVYAGYYSLDDNSGAYGYPEGTVLEDCFYGKCGFLGNDEVEYWQPRHDGDKKPTFEKEYDESKYFVDGPEN